VPPPRIDVEDTARVADVQHPDPLFHGPGDDGAGGFVLGLPDPASMPALHQPGPPPVRAPSP
jgi:hypothetical protein